MSEPNEKPVDAEGELAPGAFAYDGLDRIIHEKARLGIMTALALHPGGLRFQDLKDACTLTDGNLSRHLDHLQSAGFVEIWKRFQNNRPQTLCRITESGHKRFLDYVGQLESVLQKAAEAKQSAAAPTADISAEGWAPAT